MGGSSAYVLKCKSSIDAFNVAESIINTCVKNFEPPLVYFDVKKVKRYLPYKNLIKNVHEPRISGYFAAKKWEKLNKILQKYEFNSILIYLDKEPRKEKFTFSVSYNNKYYNISFRFNPKFNIDEEFKIKLKELIKNNLIPIKENNINLDFNRFETKIGKTEINRLNVGGEPPIMEFNITIFDNNFSKFCQSFEFLLKNYKSKKYTILLDSNLVTLIDVMEAGISFDNHLMFSTSAKNIDIDVLIKYLKRGISISLSWGSIEWVGGTTDTSYSGILVDLSEKKVIVNINYKMHIDPIINHIENVTKRKFRYNEELRG